MWLNNPFHYLPFPISLPFPSFPGNATDGCINMHALKRAYTPFPISFIIRETHFGNCILAEMKSKPPKKNWVLPESIFNEGTFEPQFLTPQKIKFEIEN